MLLLAGCGEVINEYYLSNHTDQELIVRMTPIFVDTVDLASAPLIADIRSSVRSSLQSPVSSTREGDILTFTIPARTTAFLGFSHGGFELFSQLEITTGDGPLVIKESDVGNHFTVTDWLIGPVVHVLNWR